MNITPYGPASNELGPRVSPELEALASSLAQGMRISKRRKPLKQLMLQLDRTIKEITAIYEWLSAREGQDRLMAEGSRWLLDNYHNLILQARGLRKSLKNNDWQAIPSSTIGRCEPRAYVLAAAFLRQTNGILGLYELTGFIHAYQRTEPLTSRELWAMAMLVEMALIERLGELLRANREQREREECADRIVDGILTDLALPPEQAVDALRKTVASDKTLEHPEAQVELLAALRSHGITALPLLNWLEGHIRESGSDPNAVAWEVYQRRAGDQATIGNCFLTLQTKDSFPWARWYGQVSHLERILRLDPARIYSRCDPSTRDRYRGALVRMADRVGRTELDVAQELLAFVPAEAHIGAYLIGDKREEFMQRLGLRPNLLDRLSKSVRSHALVLYLTASLALTLAIATLPGLSFLLLLALLPASEIALRLTQWAISALTVSRKLPKMNFRSGVPDEHRTAVVVHGLFTDSATIGAIADLMEIHYLSSRDPNIYYIFLADFPDSPTQTAAGDGPILQSAKEGIERLNQRHFDGGKHRFFLCYRDRKWNPAERCFMGWERKRGKLMELNAFIRNRGETTLHVHVGDAQLLKSVRYVITLDEDSHIPPGSATRLIAAIAHPLNRPVIDPVRRVVTSGFGILQPRIGTTLESTYATRFTKLYAPYSAVDPYSSGVSDIYQDLFGEASFYGKGIYDVETFEQVLHNRLPENQVLSHDLLEGLFTRVALAGEIELQDDFPSTFSGYARRAHRWIRGDWQLLQFLGRTIPNGAGGREPNPLPALARWKLIDNLRRSLVAPSSLLLLTLNTLTHGPYGWTLLVLATVGLPLVQTPFFKLVSRGPKLLMHAITEMATLAYSAILTSHGILTALYRSYISRKYLLQWTPARYVEQSQAKNKRQALLELVAAGVFGLVLAYVAFPDPLSMTIYLSWALSPWLIPWLGRPVHQEPEKLSSQDDHRLRAIAADHWKYFDQLMTAKNHFLVPDNLQMVPKEKVALRTSPTNMSLSLLSIISAYDLGIIALPDALHRLSNVFSTLAKLPTYRGHFYNWYDISNLKALHPRYVSTVDSGNLVAHLIAIRSTLQDFLATEDDQGIKGEITALIQRCNAIIVGTDFTFLYVKRDRLFSIGYNVETGLVDPYRYGLLASEARVASYVAICLGQLPQHHWFALKRSLVRTSAGPTLLSWTGTMFEYLMPSLILKDFPDTLLTQSSLTAVRAQIKYGKRHRVPWGISESAYSGVDFENTYQYRAFGVPDLALKRGLGTDLVVSPYSSLLALPWVPEEALANLARLEALGARGLYGFFESVDFTANRLRKNETHHVVRAFLGHHQAMALISINNYLNKGTFQNRFHNDPQVRAHELLLQERFPEKAKTVLPDRAEQSSTARTRQVEPGESVERINTPHVAVPRTRLLSNGSYWLVIDDSGCGFSSWKDKALTRWTTERAGNRRGTFIYVRDLISGEVWSATYQPTRKEPDSYEVVFYPEKVEFQRLDAGLRITMEVTVSPEDPVEVRRITVHNTTEQVRRLELTSYGEVVLENPNADAAHPSFSKLFVRTEYDPMNDALYFERRPRTPEGHVHHMMHCVSMPLCTEPTQFESDRRAFVGRGQSIQDPRAAKINKLEGHTGDVLDAAFSLRVRMVLPQGGRQQIAFVTGTDDSRERVKNLAQRYSDFNQIDRTFNLAWINNDVEVRHEQFSMASLHHFQRLMAVLFYQDQSLRASKEEIAACMLQQKDLWKFSISGDKPMVVLIVHVPGQIDVARELMQAQGYLRVRGVQFDLVVINAFQEGYLGQFHNSLMALRDMLAFHSAILINATHLTPEELQLLRVRARVIIDANDGGLTEHLERHELFETETPERAVPSPGHGVLPDAQGFIDNGHAFQMRVNRAQLPPVPWSHVVANPQFGFLVTETGGGYTWYGNSQQNRITPWDNDPVSDARGEALYIRNSRTGAYTSATGGPVAGGDALVEYHFGWVRFVTLADEVRTTMTLSSSMDLPIKWWHVEIANESQESVDIDAILYLDWVLGERQDIRSIQLVAHFDDARQVICATNASNTHYPQQVALMGCSQPIDGWTTRRADVLGRTGDLAHPHNLLLNQQTGVGTEACGALRTRVQLAPGERKVLVFYLAVAETPQSIEQLVATGSSIDRCAQERKASAENWQALTQQIQIKTPESSFDTMMNGWLLYQVVACRLNGRSGFYQSSGAIGFRDQLQDAIALGETYPQRLHEQILLHAAHQFPEGDVQHWWHPPESLGVRTRISDDLLWLPYAVARYIEVTGDATILQESVPFISGAALADGAMESMSNAQPEPTGASIKEHCLRAIDRTLRMGRHGLPLMGGGDWNDGMNSVGHKGQGESVWLGWMLLTVLKAFSPYAEERADEYGAVAHALLAAIEQHGWDGAWYRRAYFDDGTPLGSATNDACQIDSLSQSWAAISGAAPRERAETAMRSVLSRLVDHEAHIIRLFDPPFTDGPLHPGYVKAYPPGVRENGGQYTHAAAWVIQAAAELGWGNETLMLWQLINPIEITKTIEGQARYRNEPYVFSGDVYGSAPYMGRGGWSWYTGAAGWMYQAGLRHILGLRVKGDRFTVAPCIPSTWTTYSLRWKNYAITVENPQGKQSGITSVTVDGIELSDKWIPIDDSGKQHTVRVVM